MLKLLKWVGTVLLITGTVINSLGFYPLGPLVLSCGSFTWLSAAIIMRDTPLVVTNLILGVTGLMGVIYTVVI